MWFLLDDFCLIDLFLCVLVEFFEIGCFVFVSDVDVGVAADFGFNIWDIVWLAFANLLPVVSAVAAFIFVVAVIAIVFTVAKTVLFAAVVLVVTVICVTAVAVVVVVWVGTIVEVLNWVSGSTLWITVSHRSTSKQVYLFKCTSII